MFEMGFYLIAIMVSGYITGSMFVKIIINVRYNYNIKNYFNMILNILAIPFIPIVFIMMIISVGIGVEIFYIFLTGQL